MEELANPFKSIAPTSPTPLIVDYIPLANALPEDPSKVKVVTDT